MRSILRGHKDGGDFDIQAIISEYMICRIGQGEMGGSFNWPFGSIAETPSFFVECFQIIDSVIQEHNAANRQSR